MVANAMARDPFEEISRFIHCADNTRLDVNDRMAKACPIMNILNKKFVEAFPVSLDLDLDETMIEYFGRHGCKQTIRNKPVRFGFKAWCLNGYLLQLDIYQGATGTDQELDKCYGKGGATLIRLLNGLPQDIKSLPLRFFTDDYFTGFPRSRDH